MKARVISIVFLLFMSILTVGQKVIYLSVNQPPEFGISINSIDTTILIGSSVILGEGIEVYGGAGDYQYLWTPSETLDSPTSFHPLATPKDTTIYSLTVTDKNGCSISINFKVNTRGPLVNSTFTEKPSDLDAIIFPNPNDGKFKVNISGISAHRIVLSLMDVDGRRLLYKTITNFSGNHTELIDIHLANGIYSLRIEAGERSIVRQFVIH